MKGRQQAFGFLACTAIEDDEHEHHSPDMCLYLDEKEPTINFKSVHFSLFNVKLALIE